MFVQLIKFILCINIFCQNMFVTKFNYIFAASIFENYNTRMWRNW